MRSTSSQGAFAVEFKRHFHQALDLGADLRGQVQVQRAGAKAARRATGGSLVAHTTAGIDEAVQRQAMVQLRFGSAAVLDLGHRLFHAL